MKRYLTNGNIILPTRILPNGWIEITGTKITAIGSGNCPAKADCEIIDAQGRYISPGFIDIHVHGGGGHEFMCESPETIQKICAAHARCGTTSILPTTFAAPMQDILTTIDAVKEAQKITTESNILGVHLEGPYFAQSQRGAQNPEHILTPKPEEYIPLLDRWDGIRIVGAAPEVDGALEFGQELHRRGITASIAHSDADWDDVVAGIENGYTDVTHIYSGCSMVHRVNGYRIAGIVEAGLYFNDLSVQVIADGKHLPASLLKLIYRCKGPDKISLITDALFAAAADYPEGKLIKQKNGMETLLEDGVMKLPDRQAFAGSIATTSRLVHNMIELAGADLVSAVKMATCTPARVIHADDRKGRIAVGYDADLLVIDDQINVYKTIVMGNTVFTNSSDS